MDEVVNIQVRVEYASQKALLVVHNDKELWIPKSQIVAGGQVDGDSKKGDKGDLNITKWIAEQKGIE